MNSNKRPSLLVLRWFYAIGPIIFLDYSWTILENSQKLSSADWLWPLAWMGKDPSPILFMGVYFAAIVANMAAAFRPSHALRICAGIGWLFVIAEAFSFGRITNSTFAWMLCALLLAIPTLKTARQVWIALRSAQAVALAIYFCAGLWKLRSLTYAILHRDGFFTEILPGILPNHMAYGLAEGNSRSWAALQFFSQHPRLSTLAYLGVVAMQLSTIFWLRWPRLLPFFAFILLGFHFGSALVIGPGFNDHALLVIYLFFIFPTFWSHAMSKSLDIGPGGGNAADHVE